MNVRNYKTKRLRSLCKKIKIFDSQLHFQEFGDCASIVNRTDDNGKVTYNILDSFDKNPRKRYVKLLDKILHNEYVGMPHFSSLEEYVLKLAIRGE